MPSILDLQAFGVCASQVTHYALEKIVKDREACKQAVSTGATEIIANEGCSCELLLRFSLPCKHRLLHVAQSGQSIPRSLSYPRW